MHARADAQRVRRRACKKVGSRVHKPDVSTQERRTTPKKPRVSGLTKAKKATPVTVQRGRAHYRPRCWPAAVEALHSCDLPPGPSSLRLSRSWHSSWLMQATASGDSPSLHASWPAGLRCLQLLCWPKCPGCTPSARQGTTGARCHRARGDMSRVGPLLAPRNCKGHGGCKQRKVTQAIQRERAGPTSRKPAQNGRHVRLGDTLVSQHNRPRDATAKLATNIPPGQNSQPLLTWPHLRRDTNGRAARAQGTEAPSARITKISGAARGINRSARLCSSFTGLPAF